MQENTLTLREFLQVHDPANRHSRRSSVEVPGLPPPSEGRLRRVLTSEIQTAALQLLQCVRLFRSLR
jgi:hypothetical protein